jgi:hypothetical protein
MVVPIYKQWTANTIRIQIVEQDNIIQLLAFFEEFSHADAMNFQLKPQDEFQKSDKGGKASVRLVDCKFALPVEERKGEGKMGKEEGRLTGWAGMKRRFVCLDQIEYPGEHDDMVISFESSESKYGHAFAHEGANSFSTRQIRRSAPVGGRLAEVHRQEEDIALVCLFVRLRGHLLAGWTSRLLLFHRASSTCVCICISHLSPFFLFFSFCHHHTLNLRHTWPYYTA